MSKLLRKIYHYFVPGESNNQRAKILQPSFLSLFVAVFLVAQFGLQYFTLLYPQVLGYASNISIDRLLELTNAERAKAGLPALRLNGTLNNSAQMKAGDMFALDYWAHNSPTGRSPWTFFRDAGYSYVFAGENLARDFNDSEGVVAAWMNSPTHRDNIVNGQYEEMGIAVVNGTLGGVETTLVVQHFGTPTSRVASAVNAQTDNPTVVETVEEIIKPKPALAGGEATSGAWLSDLIAARVIQQDEGSKPLVSPFEVTKWLAVFMAGLLIGVLLIDMYLVARKKAFRLSGRTVAHLAFILFVLLAVFITQQGAVL